MEKNIDAMKYRKSSHLAGVDVDMLENKVVTIKECYYDTNVNVSGNNSNGYFITFKEDIKDMMVNSTNRVTITKIVKEVKNLTLKEARNIGNWADVQIELFFNEQIKMMGKVTGGIRIKPNVIKLPELTPESKQWDAVVKALVDGYTIDQIKQKYSLTAENEAALIS